MILLLSLCFCHVVRKACCYTLQWRSPPTWPLSVGISFKPLPWRCLTLPAHICMSCVVSAKVHYDFMGPDGSIFPADSSDCHAQVWCWVCPLSQPFTLRVCAWADWLAHCTYLSHQWGFKHGSCRFVRLLSLLSCSLSSISPCSLSSCPHFLPFFH